MTFSVVNGHFTYPRAASPLLTNINFSVDSGELLAILGPNGSGKTTLVKAMTGLKQWTKGATFIDGVNVADLSSKEIGQTIAYVPQARSALSLSLTGLDMVVLGRTSHLRTFAQPGAEEHERAWATLVSIGAEHLAHIPCGNMSGGQFQMVLIARALVAQPRVLILDEPETGLDFHNQLVVLNLLKRLAQDEQLTVVMNTHYPAHAIRVADHVLLIDSDHHATFGSAGDILTQERLSDIFDVDICISECEYAKQRFLTVTAVDVRS